MAAIKSGASLALSLLSLSLLLSGCLCMSNLRPLLGKEYVRPLLLDGDSEVDLTFRGDILGDAVLIASREVESQREKDVQGSGRNESATAGYPSQLHRMHRMPHPEVKNDSYFALTAIRATKLLQEKLALSGDEVAFRLPLYDLASTRLGNVCPPHHGARYPACDADEVYRTADGTCNNVQFSWWGSARSAFVRLLPPDYGDKVDSPRLAADGSQLPSARLVSAACLSQRMTGSDLSERISLMVMQWGQFIDHDLSHTPMNTVNEYGRPIACCGLPAHLQHPDCYPIPVPQRDSLYREHGQTCMEFARSLPAVHNGCGLGPREQVNQVTSYIDGSAVYGSSSQDFQRLRQFSGGQMKMENSRLPTTDDEGGCIRQRSDVKCFQAGDIRANEQPDLTTLHTLWVREHNRVAGKLQRYCPRWDDETLFQESRRLVSATLQHITYREWLPVVIGAGLMGRHDLQPMQEGYYRGYSPNVDATISNVFATGAMRFGHTLVPDHLMLFTPWHTKLAGVSLQKNFFRPHSLYHPGRIDEYMAGLANANSSEADNYLVDTIRNKLFAPLGSGFGLDLGALNIQRGRDHGLPSYVQWRRACGLSPVTSFADLKAFMNPLAVARLITTYKEPADVDLYAGGLLETPIDGALVGPTLACLIANQFQTLRRGDRFWYENGDERHSFTPAQLAELRKVTLSRVICDNSALATIQKNIMFKPDEGENQRVKCHQLPALDLRVWAGQLGCPVPPAVTPTRPGWRPGPPRPLPSWPGAGPLPLPGTGAGSGRPTGYPSPWGGYWPQPQRPQPQPWPVPGPVAIAGEQTPGIPGASEVSGGTVVDPGFIAKPPVPWPIQPPQIGSESTGMIPDVATSPPMEVTSSAAPPTKPDSDTDDSVERPVYPGSEPTEPVRPTEGSEPSGDGFEPQAPSWEPQPPSQPLPEIWPVDVFPVEPPVSPPSQQTQRPAVIPVDPPIEPPGPEPVIVVDPPRGTTPGPTPTPRPTPGPAVIPVDPAILPLSKPTPGPLVPVPVSPPVLPPGEPLNPIPVDPPVLAPAPAPAPEALPPLPTPGPHQPIHPPVLAPAPAPTTGPRPEVLPPLPTPGPNQPIDPPILAPAPAPIPGSGEVLPPLPTPGPDQPVHPPVLAPAPAPVPDAWVLPPLPTPGPDQPVHPPVLAPAPAPVPDSWVLPPLPTPEPDQPVDPPILAPAPAPGPGIQVFPGPIPPPGPGQGIAPTMMMMSAMTLTVPATLWPTTPGKQLVIVAGTKPVVTIIPVPQQALGPVTDLVSLSPIVIFPSRNDGPTWVTSSDSGRPMIPQMTIEATGSFTTYTMQTSLTASLSVTPVIPTMSTTPVMTVKPMKPLFPPGFDPDYPDIPPGESIEIEPTDTGPSGEEQTVTIPDVGGPDYPDYPDYGKPVVDPPEYPDYGGGVDPGEPEYPDYGKPVVEPEYPDGGKPVPTPEYPDYGPDYPDYGGWTEQVVEVPTSPTGPQIQPSTPPTKPGSEDSDFDYPTIPAGESIEIEPTDTEYDDGPPTVVWVPDLVLPGGGDSRPTSPQLEPSVQQMGPSSAAPTGTTSTPTSYPAGGWPTFTGGSPGTSEPSSMTGAAQKPITSSSLTEAYPKPAVTSILTGATLKPSVIPFLTGVTLKPSVIPFLTGVTLLPSVMPFLTGVTLKPSVTSILTGATLKPSISFITGATLKPSVTSILTGATLKPSISFITGATLKPSISFITGATLKPSVVPFLTGATLRPSVTSILTGATLKPSIPFITGATLKPSVTPFLTGATLKPSVTPFLTGVTLKPSISFITGATLKPSVTPFLTGATLKPSVTSILTGVTLKPSVTSILTGATLKPSITSISAGATFTKPGYPAFTFRPSRPASTTTWLTFDTVVVTSSGQLITTIRPGLTAVTVRPTATAAPPMVVTSIVWPPRPGPAVWPPRPRPGPPIISIIAGPTPTMSGVHRPGSTLTIESASMEGTMPAPAGTPPRPTATLTLTVMPGRPVGGYPAAGGYPRPGSTPGGYPRPGGTFGGYPGQGGSIGGYPRPGGGWPGGSVGGYPRPGGSVEGYPGQGGSVGGYPSPGGSVGGYPRPGGSVGGYPMPGGSVGGYPSPGGSAVGYPMPGGSVGGYPRPCGSVGGYPSSVGSVGGYPSPAGSIGGYPMPGGSNGGYPSPGGSVGGYPMPPLGGDDTSLPPTGYPRPTEPDNNSDGSEPNTKPTGDKPGQTIPEEAGGPVQTKPAGDIKPIPVLPPETGRPVETKPIGDIKPIPVLPPETGRPVETKPIGDIKPIPVLPAEPDDPVQTKPIGDVKPIPVLPAEPGQPTPTDDPQPDQDQQPPNMLQMKPNGQAQPSPGHTSDSDSNILTKPIGQVKPIPVFRPDPQPPTTSSVMTTSTTQPWTQRPTTKPWTQNPPKVTTQKPSAPSSSRPAVTSRPVTTGSWHPKPTTTTSRPMVTTCEATGAWRWIPGMTQWCASNCLMKNPPFCPPTHCRCW